MEHESNFKRWVFCGVMCIAVIMGWYHLYQWLRSGFHDGVAASMQYGSQFQIHIPDTNHYGTPIIAMLTNWNGCKGNVYQLNMLPGYRVNGRTIFTTSVCYGYQQRSDRPINPQDAQYLYHEFLNKRFVTFEINLKTITFSTRGFQQALQALTQQQRSHHDE